MLPSPSSNGSFVSRNGSASPPTVVSNTSDKQKSTSILCDAISALEVPWYAIVLNTNTRNDNKPPFATTLFRTICQNLDPFSYRKKDLEEKVYDELIKRLPSVKMDLREELKEMGMDDALLPEAPKTHGELWFLLEGESPTKKQKQENDPDDVDDNVFREKKRSKKDPHNDTKVYGRIVDIQDVVDTRVNNYVKEKLKSKRKKIKAAQGAQLQLISPSTTSPRRHSGTTSSSLTDSTSPDDSIRSSLSTGEEPPVYSTMTLASLVATRRLEFEAFSQVPNMEDVCLDRLTENHGALLTWMETAPICIEIDDPWMVNHLNELLNRNLQRILARVRANQLRNDPHDPDSSGPNGKDSDGAGPGPFHQDGRNTCPGDSRELSRQNRGTNPNFTGHGGSFSHDSLGKSRDVSSPVGNHPHSNDVDSISLDGNDSDDKSLPSSSSQEEKGSRNKYQTFGKDSAASTLSDDESSNDEDSDDGDFHGGAGPCSTRSKLGLCDMEGKTIGDVDHLQNVHGPVIRSCKDPPRSPDAAFVVANLSNHLDSECVYIRITNDEKRDEMVGNYISSYQECNLPILSIDDIKQQAMPIVIKRNVDSSKKKDLVQPLSITGVADSLAAAADLSKTKTQNTTPKNSSTKKDFFKLAKQVVLQKFREKSDRSMKHESSRARSTRRLTSSDDTVETACSTTFSSDWTPDDESVHSQLLDVASTSTSVHSTELQADVSFESAMNEVAVVRSSVSMDEVLQSVLSKELRSQEEQNERLAIIASREHRDFYVSFTRQLYCMIASCEVLSSDMVMSGNGNRNGVNVVLFLGKRMAQTESLVELARRTRLGKLLATTVNALKENLAVIPFRNALGSILAVVLTLKSERERYIAIQQVADFATAVSVAASTTGTASSENGLRMTTEHIARTMVRARCFLPRRAFVEERSKFGRIKQSMLHVLGETSTNTPAMVQAFQAAFCVLAHIMTPPDRGGLLYDSAEVARGSVDIHEVLVAASLHTSVEEIQGLPRFSPDVSSLDGSF